MSDVLRDLRYAFRALARRPGFTAAAVLTLALGIGATTAIFSVVNGVVLRALPYEQADRIVMLERADKTDPDDEGGNVSPVDLHDWGVAGTLESLAIYDNTGLTLTGMGDAQRVSGASVSPRFFGVFRSSPVIGRTFTESEMAPQGPNVVVIGHGFWQERMGGRSDVLGQTLELGGESYAVVGVAPPAFDFPNDARLWTPLRNDPNSCGRGCIYASAVGRLAEGATLAQSREELRAIAARIEQEFPSGNRDVTVRVERLQDEIVGSAREALIVLLLAVLAVLLIACVNVANLLLARGAARKEEVAVRAALGAGSRRLAVQMLTESGALALVGGAVGVLLAWIGVDALRALSPGNIPRLEEVALDGWTLLFAVGLVVITALVAGLAPAAQVGRVPLSAALREGGRNDGAGRRAGLGRSALLVAEVALSVLLLAGAGLLLRSFVGLASVDPGFQIERVARFGVSLPDARYGEPGDRVRFQERLTEELRALPGVEAVGHVLGAPLQGSVLASSFTHTDRPPPEPGLSPGSIVRYVDPGYFETLGMSLVAGRGLEAADRYGAQPAVVINESAAQRFWPDESPIGKQIEMGITLGYPEDRPRTVVGVVSDIRSLDLAQEPRSELYVPTAQAGVGFVTFLLRTRGEPAAALPSVRRVVQRLDPDLPLIAPGTLEESAAAELARPRFMLLLVGLFALVAVVLAAVGIYGVVAYVVSGRTREIGIRIALGASAGSVRGLVLRQGLRPAAIGVAIGVGGALAGTRIMRGLLYDVSPNDPVTLVAVTLVLLAAAGAACLLPATRAARIPPAAALRNE